MSYKSTNNLQKNWRIGFDLPPKIRFLAMYSAVEPVAHALFTFQLNTTTSFYLRENSSITMFYILSIAIFKSYHHQNKNSKIPVIQRLLLTRICSRTVFLIFFKKISVFNLFHNSSCVIPVCSTTYDLLYPKERELISKFCTGKQ